MLIIEIQYINHKKMASSDESDIVCLKEEYIVYYQGKPDIIDLTMDENEDDTSCITHISETCDDNDESSKSDTSGM